MAVGFFITPEKCTECERCMIACSQVKTGNVRLLDSRISICNRWPEPSEIRVCRFDDCEDHACIGVCPVEAITEDNGMVVIDEDACIGCEACVEACPYNAIRMQDDKAWKCDFCGGDPACVKECVTGALLKKEEKE